MPIASVGTDVSAAAVGGAKAATRKSKVVGGTTLFIASRSVFEAGDRDTAICAEFGNGTGFPEASTLRQRKTRESVTTPEFSESCVASDPAPGAPPLTVTRNELSF